jgi:hypothetical protein
MRLAERSGQALAGEPCLGGRLDNGFAVARDEGIDPDADLFRDALGQLLAGGRRRSVEGPKCTLGWRCCDVFHVRHHARLPLANNAQNVTFS